MAVNASIRTSSACRSRLFNFQPGRNTDKEGAGGRYQNGDMAAQTREIERQKGRRDIEYIVYTPTGSKNDKPNTHILP
ncbi:hypothetical protein BaRGS_00027956 [Batillaria attramentaria]|uniref:Uncharacterized protein n=1 Tax=Batillaria attramentaria TaxID=370345 RepID=A0ABD0K1T4_9CAEN